jgi:hypothetical protein
LVFYQHIEHKWGREVYIEFCYTNERNQLLWMKAGFLSYEGLERGWKKEQLLYTMEMKS